MDNRLIFWPALAMVVLVAIVTFRMFFERKRQVVGERIPMREIASGSQMATRFADTRAADNYRNLFETPVLFYVALLAAFVSGDVTPLVVGLAWIYVALRYMHSYIHCTYNRIKHRLYAFFAGNIVLWALWGVLAVSWLRP